MFESFNIEESKQKEKQPIAELLFRIREWDKSWDEYFLNGKKPLNVTDFLEVLNKEFEVKKRVEYVTSTGDREAVATN